MNTTCPQCGKLLGPYEQVCNNCGASIGGSSSIAPTQYASPSSAIPPTQYANPSSSVAPTQYASPSSSIPPTQYADSSASYGGSAYPMADQPPIEATQYASPPASDPYSSSPYGAASPYESSPYGVSSSSSAAPPPPVSAGQLPQARKGPNVGLIIGIVVLLVVLIGGGVFFAIGRGTSTSKGANLAATAQPSTQVLFSDNFADGSKGWKVSHGPNTALTISNNMLTLTNNTANDYVGASVPTNTVFTDFAVTVAFTIGSQADPGDSAQIGLRTNSDFTREYRVDFFGNQMFDIVKDYLDSNNNPQVQMLLPQTQTSLLNPVGQQNTVTVIMKGTKIVVEINKAVVGMASDPDLPNGGIALFAQTDSSSSGVKISFTNVTVTAAPNQLPSQ